MIVQNWQLEHPESQLQLLNDSMDEQFQLGNHAHTPNESRLTIPMMPSCSRTYMHRSEVLIRRASPGATNG